MHIQDPKLLLWDDITHGRSSGTQAAVSSFNEHPYFILVSAASARDVHLK